MTTDKKIPSEVVKALNLIDSVEEKKEQEVLKKILPGLAIAMKKSGQDVTEEALRVYMEQGEDKIRSVLREFNAKSKKQLGKDESLYSRYQNITLKLELANENYRLETDGIDWHNDVALMSLFLMGRDIEISELTSKDDKLLLSKYIVGAKLSTDDEYVFDDELPFDDEALFDYEAPFEAARWADFVLKEMIIGTNSGRDSELEEEDTFIDADYIMEFIDRYKEHFFKDEFILKQLNLIITEAPREIFDKVYDYYGFDKVLTILKNDEKSYDRNRYLKNFID